jgi:hypothetical protein
MQTSPPTPTPSPPPIPTPTPTPTLQPPSPPQPPPPWTQARCTRKLVSFKDSQVNPSFLGHLLLSVSIIVFAIIFYKIVLNNVFSKADEWKVCSQIPRLQSGVKARSGLEDSPLNLEQIKQNIVNLGEINSPDPTLLSQKVRFVAQVEQLNQVQRSACTIGIFYFANRTATSTIATAAGIATLASLAFVSKRGWEQSNNTIINIGVTSGFILFSTWTFSQLYGQGSNFESQRTKQNLAINLLNWVASASANRSAEVLIPNANNNSKEVVNLNTSAGMKKFIQALDTELQTLHKLDFGLDETFAKNAALRISPFFPLNPNQAPAAPALSPGAAPALSPGAAPATPSPAGR